MPRKKLAEKGCTPSKPFLRSRARQKSEGRSSKTLESTGTIDPGNKHDVGHRLPLKDSTNFSESTPKRSPVDSKSHLDLLEMDWGDAPSVSPIQRDLWSPESSSSEYPASSSSQEKPRQEAAYYIAPKLKVAYDLPVRPHVRKKIKKQKTNQAELEVWMKKMNEEFAETEKHELVVVRDKR